MLAFIYYYMVGGANVAYIWRLETTLWSEF